MTEYHLLASSNSREWINDQIRKYFFNPNIVVDDNGNVFNGAKQLSYRVVKKQARYRFERIQQGATP